MNIFRRVWHSLESFKPFNPSSPKTTKTNDIAEHHFSSSPPPSSSHSFTATLSAGSKIAVPIVSSSRSTDLSENSESGGSPLSSSTPEVSSHAAFPLPIHYRDTIEGWQITADQKAALFTFLERMDENPIQTIYRHDDVTLPIRPPFSVYVDREKGILTLNVKKHLGKGSSSTTKETFSLTSLPLAMSTVRKDPAEPQTPEQSRLKYEKIVRISQALKDVPYVLHYRLGASYPGRDFREKTPLFSEAMTGDFLTLEEVKNLFSADGLSFGERLEIAIGLAEGLAGMHAAGIIHNDLKMENLFLTKENGKWVAYIGDYDLSLEKTSPVDQKHLLHAGTPGYASPEKLFDRILPGQIEKGDVYSLGIIYEWIFSEGCTSVFEDQVAFIERKISSITYQNQIESAVQTIRTANYPHIETGIYGVISQLYEVNPSKRLTAEHTVQALKSLKSSSSI